MILFDVYAYANREGTPVEVIHHVWIHSDIQVGHYISVGVKNFRVISVYRDRVDSFLIVIGVSYFGNEENFDWESLRKDGWDLCYPVIYRIDNFRRRKYHAKPVSLSWKTYGF